MPNTILRPGGPPAKAVGRTEGDYVFQGTIGVRHILDKAESYSWVIEGRLGALLGEEVTYGGPADFIFKPRARILEIISPAGFEQFFDELTELVGVDQISSEHLEMLCARYELEMDVDSVPELCRRFGMRFPGERI